MKPTVKRFVSILIGLGILFSIHGAYAQTYPSIMPTAQPPVDLPLDIQQHHTFRDALDALSLSDFGGWVYNSDEPYDVYVVKGLEHLVNLPHAESFARFHTVSYSLRQLYDLQFALRPLYDAGVRVTKTNVPLNRVNIFVLDPADDLEAQIAQLCPDPGMFALLNPEKDESDGAYLARDAFGLPLVEEQRTRVIEQAMNVLLPLDESLYGGLYYSEHAWVLNVNVLADHPEVVSLLPDEPDIVRIHEVEYSYQELRDFQDQLGAKWDELGIYMTSVQVDENRVEIGLINETDEILNRLHTEFPNADLYYIKQQKRDWREDPQVSPYTNEQLAEGVEMRLDKDAYTAGEVKLEIDLTSRSDTGYSHGDLFLLEIQEQGLWYEMPMIAGFSDLILYKLSAVQGEHFTREIERTYGALQPGHYRLILDFKEGAFATAEFSVTNP